MNAIEFVKSCNDTIPSLAAVMNSTAFKKFDSKETLEQRQADCTLGLIRKPNDSVNPIIDLFNITDLLNLPIPRLAFFSKLSYTGDGTIEFASFDERFHLYILENEAWMYDAFGESGEVPRRISNSSGHFLWGVYWMVRMSMNGFFLDVDVNEYHIEEMLRGFENDQFAEAFFREFADTFKKA